MCRGGSKRIPWAWLAFCLCAVCAPAAEIAAQEVLEPPIAAGYRNWGFWFTSEALYMSHSQFARSVPVIDGPEAFRLGDADFGWQPGTRMTAGYFEGDYEVSGSYLYLSPWSTGRSGALLHGLDFDGPLTYLLADPAARTTVDAAGNPNFLAAFTMFSTLNTAANASGETDALEFLRQGARFDSEYTTNFSDVEINFSQREQFGRDWRFGIGFRHTRVQESAFAGIAGTFGTILSNGVGVPFNNGLSDGAITGAGLDLVSAAGTNNGFSDVIAAPPTAADQLLLTSDTVTTNQLYGVQVSTEAYLYQSENVSLSFFAKPGIYINRAKGTVSELYADTLNDRSTYVRSLYDRETSFSFVGQVGTTCRFYLLENVCLSAGYEMFYVTGLALASDQLAQISTPVTGAASLSLRTDNAVFIHGGRLGLEIAF